ncbi:MAG: dihydropteroate synthase [Candidatus Thermoplasmatota archaeon]|jgi:dihydropteroate synthase|nr:dihydropteroate synthase [Candidatus Thermoplasmatota archaeon]MCL5962916.1 dihydropteroate synthase [Candidatus Thermoplasmatota archaeon]
MKKNVKRITVYGCPFHTEKEIAAIMKRMDVDPAGIAIMTRKSDYMLIHLKNLDVKAANILKQELLAIGGDLAISKKASMFRVKHTDAIAMATVNQYTRLVKKLAIEPFNLRDTGKKINMVIENAHNQKNIKIFNKTDSKIKIMGVLNVTPDSFYDGGKYIVKERAIDHAMDMIKNGADIIDVGGESSRPGSKSISVNEEIERVIPVIKKIDKKNTLISIDTTKPEVADASLNNGADIINDINGFRSERMVKIASKWKCGAVIMHMQGTPQTMQKNPAYDDIITDIYNFFETQISVLEKNNIDNIIIDPGIGFGKTVEHNIDILKNLSSFKSLGYPIAIGVSRKSFIGEITKREVDERLYGTLAAEAIAIMNGATILRVHDISQTVDLIRVIESITNTQQ